MKVPKTNGDEREAKKGGKKKVTLRDGSHIKKRKKEKIFPLFL